MLLKARTLLDWIVDLDVSSMLIGTGKQLCLGKSFWRVRIKNGIFLKDNCLEIWKSHTQSVFDLKSWENLCSTVTKWKKKLKKYCTMSPIMAIPETTLGNRFSGGKCGSSKPVTGFRSTAGANAAKVGRGLSWKENRKSRMLYTLISCALISARALLSLSGVGGVTQVTKILMYRFSQDKKRSSRGIFKKRLSAVIQLLP